MQIIRSGQSLAALIAVICLIIFNSIAGYAREVSRPQINAQTIFSVVQNARLLDPPRESPPVVESDYTKYFGEGTGQLVVPMVVTLQNGTKLTFTDAQQVFAYPATPFTRWMIEKYSQQANGVYLDGDRNMFPGQYRSGITVPPYLQHDAMVDAPKRSAVRVADHCDSAGECYFYNLPAGKYIIFENNFIYETRSELHSYLEPYLEYLVEHQYTTTENVPIAGLVLVGGAYEVSSEKLSRPLTPINATAFYYLPH